MNNTVVTRLSRGAVASTIAAGFLVADRYSAMAHTGVVPLSEMATSAQPPLPEVIDCSGEGTTITITLSEAPKEWTKQMDREFRQLVLRDVKGDITAEQSARLRDLTASREALCNRRSADEVLRQLRRDRLLAKISEALREYVEFQESADKKRPATG